MKLMAYLLTKPKEFDFELYDDQEEHDTATIVENPVFAWNNEFMLEWADIFNAEIVSLMPASDLNIETLVINGSSAERIEKFQFVLAGYCPESYWDKYHLPEEE